MNLAQTVRGPLLRPLETGQVDFIADAAIRCDASGKIDFIGEFSKLPQDSPPPRAVHGMILPPFLDAHIHIPQHPVRGRFMEGVGENPPEGRLLAGLKRNIFPAEARCADEKVAQHVIEDFLHDTISKGVIGGAAYMTVHPRATRIALEILPASWSVGLVLMNQNCPADLRTDETTLEADIRSLAKDFGRRMIVTDRFAVAVNTPLRKRAAALARELGLRMQTHLNEQVEEKRKIEQELYPDYANYTDVYASDGLLDREAILAHCIHMSSEEFDTIASKRSAVAHCPTSNTTLGSGVMPLDEIVKRNIPYAICTDVAASPTVSLLAEMAQFLKVHNGRSAHATPSEALFHTTLAPAKILGLESPLTIGAAMSFVQVQCNPSSDNPDEIIAHDLLGLRNDSSHRLDENVLAVTVGGREIWRKSVGSTV